MSVNWLFQLKKLLSFLSSVQSNFFTIYFASDEFNRLATVPKIVAKKSKAGWFVDVWLLNNLCTHCYPFVLPNLFSSSLKKLKKPILVNNSHAFQVLLVDYYSGFMGTSLIFPYSRGQAFYDLTKNMQIGRY
jgi:hypothetical protein